MATKKVHYDEEIVNLHPGKVAEIVATCTTKNTQPGNQSSVIVYVDGHEVARDGGERAQSEARHSLKIAGEHTIRIECSNSRADADTCVLTVTRKEIIDI